MPVDAVSTLIRCWVEGRQAREIDRGATPEEARRRAWNAWEALPAAEKAMLLSPLPARPAFRVTERTN